LSSSEILWLDNKKSLATFQAWLKTKATSAWTGQWHRGVAPALLLVRGQRFKCFLFRAVFLLPQKIILSPVQNNRRLRDVTKPSSQHPRLFCHVSELSGHVPQRLRDIPRSSSGVSKPFHHVSRQLGGAPQ
jgi:hypothetical protein